MRWQPGVPVPAQIPALTTNEAKGVMNNQFDEIAKGFAQSVTRRSALTKFGVGLTGIALATLGFTSQAHADKGGQKHGKRCNRCISPYGCADESCIDRCISYCSGSDSQRGV